MTSIEASILLTPRSLAEALAWQADPATRGLPLAGGTDLMVQWEAAARPVPPRVLNVKSLPELRGLCEAGDRIVIGASVTHAELRRSPLVQRALPALAAAAAQVGGAQIQALGTLAGNVANASPAGDLAPAVGAWIDQVRDLVMRAQSLAEIRDGLDALLPGMTLDQYAAAMAEALRAAEGAGRYEVMQEAAGGLGVGSA